LAPIFHGWCFQVDKGIQPDFVLKDDGKNFQVKDLRFNFASPIYHLLKTCTKRISGIKIEKEGVLLNHLSRNPAHFLILTSLDLETVRFDKDSLLILAPQLENLRLDSLMNSEIDISSVDEDSQCFSRLKTLILWNMEIDVKKILSKCCNKLKHLELVNLRLSDNLDNLENELSSLSYLFFCMNFEDTVHSLRNLLSKCCRSLRTLKLLTHRNCIDMSTLLDQTTEIKELEISRTSVKNIADFLRKCPLVQKLSLRHVDVHKKVKGFILKDLINLELNDCNARFMSKILKYTSKHSLRTVVIDCTPEELLKCKFPEISMLDRVVLRYGYVDDYDDEDDDVDDNVDDNYEDIQKQALDKVVKLFPRGVEVTNIMKRIVLNFFNQNSESVRFRFCLLFLLGLYDY
jgi:hypothetical protein